MKKTAAQLAVHALEQLGITHTFGIPGVQYSYSTSSTDPSGYQIAYIFDWGDGSNSTTGLFDSGAVASAGHIWNSSGVYEVRAMATNSRARLSAFPTPLSRQKRAEGKDSPVSISPATNEFRRRAAWKAFSAVIT